MKIRDLVIDADSILHHVAGQPLVNGLDGDVLEPEVDMGMLRRIFRMKVKELEDIVATETVAKKFKLGKTVLVFSDPKGNFRYDFYPDYKNNRKKSQRTKAFYKLRDWAVRKFVMIPHTEADDYVAWCVRNGAVGVSIDKDLLLNVKGRWYDSYHKEYFKTKGKAAKRFTLLQTLAGDSVDNIKGLPRVGMATAEKLLEQYGADWAGVVAAYESKGLTEDDAIFTRRLIGMDQLRDGKTITLWNP